ncbi:hypothetical protein GGI17_004899 [Coemansia sp. S146]|nr:hypothetical protein GGI17_004899 [Coemansia sp. S146]
MARDCRLILPIASKDMDAEHTDFDSPDYVDPTDFANVKSGMFPLDSSVKRQAALAPTPLLIVADAEIVGHPDDFNEAELRLATKTKALYFNQHNRRFTWELTVSNHTIHAYVFGTDGIWASTATDISSTKGHRAFISLLVSWLLCSVGRLGFGPSIRYVIDGSVGGPYLEIDVHEMDESTGKVKPHMYYSQQCLGAADRLFGRHARYFAASTSPKSMDKPAFLIKDMWAALGSGSADDTRESSFLDILHGTFDKSSEFYGSFSQLVSSGPVYINRGDTVVADSTAMAFAGLPSITQDTPKDNSNAQGSSNSKVQRSSSTCFRQHRRTVAKWARNMISVADSQSQVVVAVADAMAALNAVYVKCKILHGNIGDRAIQLQKTTDRVKGVLADFGYASNAGDSAGAVEVPELMLFQSIRCLEDPRVVRTLLDDCESLLYLVCWLGTFGVNQAQRTAYAAEYTTRCTPRYKPRLPILRWNQESADDIAEHKRSHMASIDSFDEDILSKMRENSPLHRLAVDMYMALFTHPGCSGTKPVSNLWPAAHGAAPPLGGERDPLILRNAFENETM